MLSFLTDLERALAADDPAPAGGVWQNVRSVNYHQGFARLSLGSQKPGEPTVPLGGVTVQDFRLADGSACLKACLTWQGAAEQTVHAVYETSETNWTAEARLLAGHWLAGRERVSAAEPAHERIALAM